MNLQEKISILGPNAKYDTCGPKDFGQTTMIPGVYHAKVGGSHVCRLFKVLQSNKCSNNCRYCAMRRDRNIKRVHATPDEMAKAFDMVYKKNLVDGFFLSSGIEGNSQSTMQRMIDTAHIVRDKYKYHGYLHLKIMPGTPEDYIEEAVKLANRISINIESPTETGINALSENKNLKSVFWPTLHTIKKKISLIHNQSHFRPPSLTTQFVVGANDENDIEYIKMTNILYQKFNLKRVFFSAFRPVDQTPLENRKAVSTIREHRLYQSDFLMRFYRFKPSEIPTDEKGFLDETRDPKLAWAQTHPEKFPINLNNAEYWTLLKVPGLGPTTAKKIVELRSESKIKDYRYLENMRIQIRKIKKYTIL
jgi:predicted DNA-binding helix-hairpin-helix protein